LRCASARSPYSSPLAKRLEQGTFRWPKIEDGTMRLTPSQLSALIEGLDWTRAAGEVRPAAAGGERQARRRLLGDTDFRRCSTNVRALRSPGSSPLVADGVDQPEDGTNGRHD
jgi:hypothetical protein